MYFHPILEMEGGGGGGGKFAAFFNTAQKPLHVES